jgi:hypothetical protein
MMSGSYGWNGWRHVDLDGDRRRDGGSPGPRNQQVI